MSAPRSLFLALTLTTTGLSACNGTTPLEPPTNRMDPATLASVRGHATSLVGSWHGNLSFQQIVGGEQKRTDVATALEFQADALPTQLPGLGFVGSWQNYDGSTSSEPIDGVVARLSDGRAGKIFVYCTQEADGPANEVTFDPVSAVATTATFAWRYGAQYRFADLVDYSLYDYSRDSAPTASLQATES